jgi:DNA polymerase-3 subunit alpha
MDGLNSPEELLSAAKDLGQTSFAITDHGTLSGHREMQTAARDVGLKPILGLEAYISPTDRFDRRDVKAREDNTGLYNHLIILAKDQQGLVNLNKLSEIAWTEGYYYKPRIDKELLAEYRDGLIVLSGCMSGLIAKSIIKEDEFAADQWTKWFKENLDENFYMEIQPHQDAELNHKLLALADKYSIKPVVTSDCHFANKEDRAIEEALLIISTKPKRNRDATVEQLRKMEVFERLNSLWPDRPISFEKIDVYVNGRGDIQTMLEAQIKFLLEQLDKSK